MGGVHTHTYTVYWQQRVTLIEKTNIRLLTTATTTATTVVVVVVATLCTDHVGASLQLRAASCLAKRGGRTI
jgi:hypothetical protein